jgi:hypothetical protein
LISAALVAGGMARATVGQLDGPLLHILRHGNGWFWESVAIGNEVGYVLVELLAYPIIPTPYPDRLWKLSRLD